MRSTSLTQSSLFLSQDLREFESTGLPVKIKDVLTQKANDFLQMRLTKLNTIYCTLEANTTMYIEKTSAQVQADFGQ